MFADAVLEKTGLRYPGGASHDEIMAPMRRRLRAARKYVFSREAVAMAANVAMSRPTSILAALGWVRLRSDPMWIEFNNLDLRQAMADMGSPNIRHPATVVAVVRTGFLISLKDECLSMDYVHAGKTSEGVVLTDLAPVKLSFDLSDQEMPKLGTALKPAVRGIAGKVRRRIELLGQDPREAAAEASLCDRFTYVAHPEMTAAVAEIAALKGLEAVGEIEENQSDEAWRMFSLMILPGLILLNCRNAVDTAEIVPSGKLNRSRQAKGREPLHSYETVTMHLSASARRRQALGGSRPASASALVPGHFKVRKNRRFLVVGAFAVGLRRGQAETGDRAALRELFDRFQGVKPTISVRIRPFVQAVEKAVVTLAPSGVDAHKRRYGYFGRTPANTKPRS